MKSSNFSLGGLLRHRISIHHYIHDHSIDITHEIHASNHRFSGENRHCRHQRWVVFEHKLLHICINSMIKNLVFWHLDLSSAFWGRICSNIHALFDVTYLQHYMKLIRDVGGPVCSGMLLRCAAHGQAHRETLFGWKWTKAREGLEKCQSISKYVWRMSQDKKMITNHPFRWLVYIFRKYSWESLERV
jgi:hypothetical protein